MLDAMMIVVLCLIGLALLVEVFFKVMEVVLRSSLFCSHLWMTNSYCARCGIERPSEEL